MIDYLLHFYRRGTKPFRSLSSLPDEDAIALMQSLYVEGSVFWERFKDARGYLSFRKQVEARLRQGFIAKGGRPKEEHPVYLVVGRPQWTLDVSDPLTRSTTDEIKVPFSLLNENEVSFTYPDSMVSALMAEEKNKDYYEPDFHGKVFTLREITEIINRKGLPGEGWETRMPPHFAHYIEAQVWNHALLSETNL
ncbi:MAG: hypothetical protein ABSF77_06755 [Spirochaetia bacterium]|jgi:hypothetical protein